MQQELVCDTAQFITLTYDNAHLPISNKGFKNLSKRDLQLFFKRLRKSHPQGSTPIRYYAVGEYGTTYRRPHYHIILFNAEIELIQPAWSLAGKCIGEVHYGKVSGASIGYCLKYISKGRTVPAHRNDDRQAEFSLMSKGIGSNYLTPETIEWHKADLVNRLYLTLDDGKKASMPRYYKDKLYTKDERGTIKAHWTEKIQAEQDRFDRLATAAILHAREQGILAAYRRMEKQTANNSKTF